MKQHLHDKGGFLDSLLSLRKKYVLKTTLTNGMHRQQSFLKDISKTKPYSQSISILYLFKENIIPFTNRTHPEDKNHKVKVRSNCA